MVERVEERAVRLVRERGIGLAQANLGRIGIEWRVEILEFALPAQVLVVIVRVKQLLELIERASV
jgi:hypothetical protein